MNYYDYIKILPETFCITSLLILLLIGFVLNKRSINLLILTCMATTLIILIITAHSHSSEVLLFNSLLKTNIYIRVIQGLILAIGIVILILLNLSKYNYEYEFSILISFAILGMMNLISANNLISFYLAFELMSIPLYILACFNRDSLYSCEAGVKYFTLGALSSCIMLYGMSLLYGYTGQTDFSQLTVFIKNSQITYGIIFGLSFIFISLCFKLAIAPFHMWAPDVYQGAPTIVTAFFSTAPKAALLGFLIRFMTDVLVNIKEYVQPFFLYVSVLSVMISALGALRQKNLKRLLAYSSIGHLGYIFAALSTFEQSGINSALMYLIVYIITSMGLFAYLIQLDDDHCDIKNLSGLAKKHPALAFHFTALLLSMSGIPPLLGFFTKFFILQSLVYAKFIILCIVIITASIISCYYYLNIIKVMYFDDDYNNNIVQSNKGLLSITSIASITNIALFLCIEDFYSLTNTLIS